MRGFLRRQAEKALAKGVELVHGDEPEVEMPEEEQPKADWQVPNEAIQKLEFAITGFDTHLKRQGINHDTTDLYHVLQSARDFVDAFKLKDRPSIGEKRVFTRLASLAHSLNLKISQTQSTTQAELNDVASDVKLASDSLKGAGFEPKPAEQKGPAL